MTKSTLSLDGNSLRATDLLSVKAISISSTGWQSLRNSRAVVASAITANEPIYGVTTGLGAKVSERLSPEQLANFSIQTLRGRAHAVGAALPVRYVRAAMVVRLNTFLRGAAGVSSQCAQLLADCINADLTPVVAETGSIGASDLILGAALGLALAGEGQMVDAQGNHLPSAQALADAGFKPLQPAPRDGLALASHSSFSAALAALGVARTERLLQACQAAAALSLEGFRANLSPLNPAVLKLRPQPGQIQASESLRRCLQGGLLSATGKARRLQDPLSIRNIVQIHGAALAVLDYARQGVEQEINGASDNPAVLVETGQIISCGNYHTPFLGLAIETVSRGINQLVMAQIARISKMLNSVFTDLPQHLARPGANANGLGPLLKPAEALAMEIAQRAQPVPIWPSISASGVEDAMTSAPLAAKNLLEIIDRAERISAIELLVATQAVELRGCYSDMGPFMQQVFAQVRDCSASVTEDRPLAADIEKLALQIADGIFATPEP